MSYDMSMAAGAVGPELPDVEHVLCIHRVCAQRRFKRCTYASLPICCGECSLLRATSVRVTDEERTALFTGVQSNECGFAPSYCLSLAKEDHSH